MVDQHGRFARRPEADAELVETVAEAARDETREALESATTLFNPSYASYHPNFGLVLCDVGPHSNVRVMVHPNNANYLPRMVIPMDVDLTNFNSDQLLIYEGKPPRQKGYW
jgi:hypothetical protein